MTDKGTTTVQGPDHSITTERNSARVVVLVAGRVIVDAREAVTFCEASYAAVHYVPRKGVDMAALGRSAHATHAPYRGDCAYYCVPIGVRSINAVWFYEAPYPAVAEIREGLAFFREAVHSIQDRVEA